MKNSQFRFFLIFVLVVLFVACGQRPEEIVQMVNKKDSAYKRSKSIAQIDIQFDCKYKPAEYNALMEFTSADINRRELDNLIKENRQTLRFDFQISSLSGIDRIKDTLAPDDYLKRIEYLSAQMQEVFRLIHDGDSLSPVFYHFERTYNVTQFNTFLLAFDLPIEEMKTDVSLVFQDPLFASGQHVFLFDKSIINKKIRVKL